MRILQKPAAIKLLSVCFLAILGCQTICSQKLKQPTPLFFKTCWDYATDKLTNFNFASDNADKKLYFTLSDSRIISIDVISGEKYWETDLGGKIVSPPFVAEDSTYIAAGYSNQRENGELSSNTENLIVNNVLIVRSLNKSTGLTQWEVKFTNGFSPIERIYLYGFEDRLIIVGNSGEICSVDKSDGRIVWRKKLSAELSAQPFVKDGRIFLGTLDKQIVNLSLSGGQLIGEWKTPSSPKKVVEDTSGGNLIWGDGIGSLTSFNRKSLTANWKFRSGAEISSVTFTRKGLLVTSYDNFVYLISESNGKMFWKKRLAGRISGDPLVNNNHFIITTADDSFASVIELNTGKFVNKIAIENNGSFAGQSIHLGNRFVFATLKGILSFSESDADCISR